MILKKCFYKAFYSPHFLFQIKTHQLYQILVQTKIQVGKKNSKVSVFYMGTGKSWLFILICFLE